MLFLLFPLFQIISIHSLTRGLTSKLKVHVNFSEYTNIQNPPKCLCDSNIFPNAMADINMQIMVLFQTLHLGRLKKDTSKPQMCIWLICNKHRVNLHSIAKPIIQHRSGVVSLKLAECTSNGACCWPDFFVVYGRV